MRQVWILALTVSAAASAASTPDYFPLQVGNQWVLQRQARQGTPELQQIEVLRSRVVNGHTYFLVTGYLPQEQWLRKSDENVLYARSGRSGRETVVAQLTPGAGPYSTALSGCEQTANPAPETERYRGPYLEAAEALTIRYAPDHCRDIGYTNEVYAAGVGPVHRSSTSIRGELTFDLVYARVNGVAVVAKSKEIVLRSDFNSGSKGWLAGFADYGLKSSDLRMLAELRPMPEETGNARSGFFLQGMNRSDDLFMFLKRHVSTEDGLEPNQEYRIFFDIRFASNAPTGCLGVGGAPGESVYLKAGASIDEPLTLLSPAGDVRISIDKGQQATGGNDAGLVGTIENGRECDGKSWPYVTLQKTYAHPQKVQTDNRGTLWLIVGTDSGYEGLTGLYMESITVRILPASDPASSNSRQRR